MDLFDDNRKSTLHVPDEKVEGVSFIRYDDTWWGRDAGGEFQPIPAPDDVDVPYLDLTPGMGDEVIDPNAEPEDEEDTESQ